MYLVIDRFLKSYPELRQYADTAEFKDEANPYDGVVYPLICKAIPNKIKQEIAVNLSKLMQRMVKINAMFLRLSTKGVSVPHAVHTDLSMGDHSLMIYMNTNANAGTSFVRHNESGMTYQPESQEFVDVAVRDQNRPECWTRINTVPMAENRACIFDAGVFHCAEPIGGFGENQKEGRMVLTAFFS